MSNVIIVRKIKYILEWSVKSNAKYSSIPQIVAKMKKDIAEIFVYAETFEVSTKPWGQN